MSEGIDWLENRNLLNNKSVLCIVDGEHYPPVTDWALESIEKKGAKIYGLVFAGGTEKISKRGGPQFESGEYPLYINNSNNSAETSFFNLLKKAVQEHRPELVIDLSDAPVVNLRKRFKIASLLFEEGVAYAGADFVFTPPSNKKVLTKPSITIFGTGKRVGKTAASISIARSLKSQGIKPAVVAMGRGGPPEPQLVLPEETKLSSEFLLDIAKKGDHAASDYWENALLSGIPSIGCRRCGGGLAGSLFISNVSEGAQIATDLPIDLVIMEGSGPTLPPVATDRKIIVTAASQSIEDITDFFNEFRLLRSDLAIVTMCEEPTAGSQKIKAVKNAIRKTNPDIEILLTVFRPDPLGTIENKKVFLATTAPDSVMDKQVHYLEDHYNCKVTGYSTNLSNRELLEKDLQVLDKSEVLLTEIKAASIDVAANMAQKNNLEIVFLHNKIIPVNGGTIQDLDQAILDICNHIPKSNVI